MRWKGSFNMRSVKWLGSIAAVLFSFLGWNNALAQEKVETKEAVKARPKGTQKQKEGGPYREAAKTLFGARVFKQTAISPDGKKVAWVEEVATKYRVPTGDTVIYVADSEGKGPAKRIGAGVGDAIYAEGSVAWSPDNQRIAFLSDVVRKGQLQLYVSNAAGGPARKLTQLKGFLSTPGWSPDGKSIAFLFTENATRAAGPLVAETPETGEIKDAFFEQRLAVVDAGGGEAGQISPADMYVYEYDWSPDGKRFTVTAAHGNGDNNWYVAELYTLEAAGGEMKSIYKPPLQIANPAWSPDGKQIVFIAGLMSDEGLIGNDIFTISATGGEPRNVTPGIKASPSWLTWMPDGKRILFAAYAGGDSSIATVETATGRVENLWRAGESISSSDTFGYVLSVAADGKRVAVVRHSFSTPPEVWAGPIGDWMQITKRNVTLKPSWGEAKSIMWKSDGYDVQGWLLYPHDFDPAKKYPIVITVHGGPAWITRSHWPDPLRDFAMGLSEMGYFALYPNPRGSFGQGESFVRANVKDFGYGDFRDILAGLDAAARVAPIDTNRSGITGWSYGGYMTMWAVTQTNRFKAAMAGAGLADWLSYYGENKIDQWMIPYFGKSVYDDPQVYAKSSPITFIKNAKTPTLILVGDSDGECPTPQSYEFWHALKTLGVETQLVVYPHEGHVFADAGHQRDVLERTMRWFDAHLK
jgi:dipeptidyl aminopeptidase/acylaminoacyl peptidase